MPRSSSAAIERPEMVLRPSNMHASIHCALVVRPDPVEKQKRQILRYVILITALAAVLLLVAIAAYYIHGNAVTIVNASSTVLALCWLGG